MRYLQREPIMITNVESLLNNVKAFTPYAFQSKGKEDYFHSQRFIDVRNS